MKALWEFLLCVTFIRRCRLCQIVERHEKRKNKRERYISKWHIDGKENK